MTGLIDKYLKCVRSGGDVSEIMGEIQNLLANKTFSGISSASLNKFVFGSDGLINFCNTPDEKCERAVTIILLLVKCRLLTPNVLNQKKKEVLVSAVLSALKKSKVEELWTNSLPFLMSEYNVEVFGSCKALVDTLCDFLLQLHTSSGQNSEAFKDACYAFSKLWDSQTCLFLRQPTLTALHSVVQILAFGMTLAKLVPETYMKNLHILSVKLKKIGLKLQSSGLIPKAHFFSIRDVVDLSPSKMLCMIGDLLPHEPYPVLGILDQLVYIFPAFIMDESTLSKIIEILMRAIRVSSQDNCDIDCETKASAEISEEPSVLALDIFVRLVDTLSSHGSKLTDLSRILLQLFDLLRAFPNTLAHSEARLHAWWHFICCLPSDLLSDGFRKFLSPFLANLLGRYLSISAPQGSSQFHPYKLSQGSVHEGNVKALELIQHVYSCFFDESSVTFHHLNVPRLSVSSQLLVQNSYPILVSLLYWIRVVSKYRHSSTPKKLKIPSHCLPSQTVDEIWFGCINHLLKISKPLDGLPVHKKITPFQSPSLSVHVSSPNSPLLLTVWQNVKTVTCELIRPSALSLSSDPEIMISSPSPMESLNIIHKLMQLLEEFKLPDKEKVDLVSSLCLKSAELGGSWLKEIPKPKSLHATKDDFHRWATLTIRLIDLDPRLNISNTSVMTRGLRFTGENNFLGLIRALVAALLPDFVDFITSRSPSESSLYDDSTQPLAYKNPKVYFSPDALRIWSVLVDRLTQFIISEHRVTEDHSAMDIDLSTVNSAMLMPFWLAGGTRPNTVDSNYYRSSDSVEYLSFKDDLAVSKRQSDLLTVFHQECCLLTTVPTNAWISQLSAKVSDLISSYAPKVFESINLHLVGRFLRCLAQRAEISEEGGNQIDAYCSFASMKTDKQPLGQLTGLVSALNLLLLHIPWLNPPTQTQSDISPPRRFNSQELIARCLASPPMLSIRNQTDQSTEEKVGSESHSNSRSLNNSPVSYGLLDALEAVTFILNNHVRDTDSVLWIFSALEPSLDRLIHCCVKAEEAVIAAGTDLDEPLLITQHRQQAKLTLEEVFICIWKQLKIVPPNVSVTNPLSMLNTMQCDQNSKTSVPNSKITRAVALDEQYQGILNLSFALCGYNLESSKGSHKSAPIQLSITFIIWFIGYWNYLVDQCCSTKTNKSKIQNVQNFLKNRESDFQKIVVQAFSLNMQQFNNLDSSEKNTNTYNSTLYKTPKSEPTKRRSRALKKMESSQSPETPINLKLEKEDGSPDSILTTLRSGRRSSLGKNKLESEKLRKPVTASPGLRASTGDSQNLSNSPSIRPRRGRLSLGRNINPVERIVTPTRRSFGPVENITQSAPSNFTARRGRGKKGVNLFPVSPRPSPASGIIADAFGVAPGSSLIEDKGNHNWSPSMPSPGPLSNRPLVKRRLFSGVQDLRTPEDNSSNSYQTSSLHPTRKRHLSDSEHNSVTSPKTVTISTGVEDSCDFVFIPPQTESAKKRRRSLTIHQKERFKEQRSEYVPVTYTELDISQQSWPSLCGSDSQSQSLPEFSPQSSENTKCLEVSETPEFLDCQMVEANNVTNILTSEDEIENSGIKDYTCQVCDKSELTPIKVVLSPLISDPVCSKDCDSKDILEMIHDTEITNNECESVNLDEEVPSKLKTLDLSCETGSNGMSNLPDNNKYDDNNDVLIVETHNSTFVSLPSGSNNNNVPSVAISKPSSKDEDHERMSPVTSLSVPPILNSRPNSHTLSSPLIRGSSRAQKMLALGLQKAAEQTARQKSSSGEQNVSNVSGILSADNSPVLTERKSFSNVFVSPSRLPFSSSATDSPSGIMRNLWSKKKSQRVSFAEQPMIYTIGSLNAFELESDEDNVYQNCSSLNSRKVLHDLTDNTCDFDDLSDNDVESKTHKESSESNQVDEKSSQNDTDLSVTSKEPSNAILISTSISVDTYVDLDASQDSSQSILSETVKSDDQTTPVILPHGSCSNHRRKSASPQRREIPIKRNFSRPKCEKSDQSRKLPRRRPLFMEPLPTTVISDNTETNTTTLSQTNEQYTVFVIDSESTMIADTQPDENDTKTDSVDNPTTVIEQTQLDEEEDECVVIEGSQGSSQVQNGEDQSVCSSGSQIDQLNFSPIPVLSNSEMSVDIQKGISSSQTIVDVLHTNPDNTNNNQSKIISVISNESSDTSSQQNMLSISIANEGDDDEDDNVSADNKENQPESTMIATQEDVERDILDKLSQIANSLPILRPEQRHSILLEALSTFKTIMP